MLSKTVEYALRIVILLTETEDLSAVVPGHRLAERARVPADYAVQVLWRLSRAGIVEGQRGRHGGYRLGRDPARTTLLEVVNAVQPIHRILSCPLGLPEHRVELCPLHKCLDDSIGYLERRLFKTTLRNLVDQSRRRGHPRSAESFVPRSPKGKPKVTANPKLNATQKPKARTNSKSKVASKRKSESAASAGSGRAVHPPKGGQASRVSANRSRRGRRPSA